MLGAKNMSHLFDLKNSNHTSRISETMQIYYCATRHEFRAVHQFHSENFDPHFREQIIVNQRNAIWYFLEAALKGYSTAQYKLGILYLHGQLGLTTNTIKAQKWLSLAANQGHLDAQEQLEQFFIQ